ncbi:GNAT family N-acetyltransferase [Caulobacter segnis]|uniref:GNAT family N-acetyltransferase n=1 Tax=Caulobacter segnis TaxID=88688 RepID=UPI00240F2A15|nr:GNAT family N-acetyltransferase [Caulobacter segnis]MDG2523152.1 GNAT family N-acetyltransferase [Caulobacter segnis]
MRSASLKVDPKLLEPIADRAWPAAEQLRMGGWRLNASVGFSQRINACWPLGRPDRRAPAAIEAVERWYAARGLAPRFKLTDGATAPRTLAQQLEKRGYQPRNRTLVMVGPCKGEGDSGVLIEARPDQAFEAVFTATAGGNLSDARERLDALRRIGPPAFFARIEGEDGPAAIGASAVEGEWAGIFAMRTAPDHRRKGLARRVLSSLMQAAAWEGATRAYLQVEADNAPAIAMYQAAGFATAYTYAYWVTGA